MIRETIVEGEPVRDVDTVEHAAHTHLLICLFTHLC